MATSAKVLLVPPVLLSTVGMVVTVLVVIVGPLRVEGAESVPSTPVVGKPVVLVTGPGVTVSPAGDAG